MKRKYFTRRAYFNRRCSLDVLWNCWVAWGGDWWAWK